MTTRGPDPTPEQAAEAYLARCEALARELLPALRRVRFLRERHRVFVGLTCPRGYPEASGIEVFECTSRLAFEVDPDVEALARVTVGRLRAELEARGARVA